MYLSVWPLPGKSNTYNDSVIAILTKIQADNPSLKLLVKWAKQKFTVKDWIKEPLRMVTFRFSLAQEKEGQLFLTRDGRRFLKTHNSEIILDRMLENTWGIKEILVWLKNRPYNLQDLVDKFNSHGASWKRKNQPLYRINWLMALGYVKKTRRREYVLSDKGKETLIHKGLERR